MSQLLIRVLVVCCVAATSDFCSTACCQVFQNSRGPAGRAAATSPRHAVVEGMAIGGAHSPGSGRRSGVNVFVPGLLTSPRRVDVPVYSNGQYSVLQYDAAANATVRTYSSRPNGTQYSRQPVDHYGSHQYGSSHFGTHRYVPPIGHYPTHEHPPTQIHIYGRPPIPVPSGYGHGYSRNIAPPIGLPYAGPAGVMATVPGPAPHLHSPTQPVPPPYSAVPMITENGAAMSRVMSVDERPIVGEFTTSAVEQTDVGGVDLIRSLRHETSGDMAFRRQDYASAEAFYRTATETAPSRRAPWLRLAWTRLAQQCFADAAANLKTALNLDDESTNSWISAGLLYGGSLHSQVGLQNQQLWNWLQERPNSTDRLLLTAAFQHLRGDSGIARELLSVAAQNGLPDSLHHAMLEIVTGVHRRTERIDQSPSVAPLSTIDSSQDTNARSQASDEDRIPPPERHFAPLNAEPLILPDAGGPEAFDGDLPAVPPIPQDVKPAPEGSRSLPADLPGRSQRTRVSV
ncbi:MAG: hypothetical protein ABGZ53_04845 [Fuerstiella sp.]